MVRLRMDSRNTTLAPIIEARQIEKFYTQPDGGRVQVIAPIEDGLHLSRKKSTLRVL